MMRNVKDTCVSNYHQRSRKPGHMGTCAQAHLPFHKGRAGTFLMNIHIFLTFFANIHIFLIFFEKAHFKLNILFNFCYIPEPNIQVHFGEELSRSAGGECTLLILTDI